MQQIPIPDSSLHVTKTDLEALLAPIERHIPRPLAGLFGPDSISWRVNRESALFLGAGRAALLQLAHPWVATALAQHSNLLHDPIARFHGTFRIVFTMIFGTSSQAFAASRALHRRHERIRGTLQQSVAGYLADSRYHANQVEALLWVYATLVESAVVAHDCVLPPLTPAEREAYYAESRTLAALFGIPSVELPPDWPSFLAYTTAMCNSLALGVDACSLSTAQSILAGSGSWIHPPLWYRALTASWMPERFREEFQLPFGPREQRSVASTQRWLPRVYRSLPSALRFTGPYHEARARLAHHSPGPFTRRFNQFWIGEGVLPFRD